MAISSVTRLPNAEAPIPLTPLLASDIDVGLQERVLKALLDLDALQDAQLWATTGATLTNKNRPGPALRSFDQALKIEPAHNEPTGSLAGALFDKGLVNGALKYFQRSSQLDPNDEKGWAGQGVCLANLEGLEQAKAAYVKAHDIKPSYTPVRDALYGIYRRLGDYEGIASLARQASN